MNSTRRAFVGGLGALATGSVAGCVDGASTGVDTGDGGDDDSSVFTAFYTLEDFTRHVVGETMAVQNPIPPGEMGHRYEVGTGAQVDAARSSAFVYLDIEGFQRWALDAAANLRSDYPDVTVIDALDGIDLLGFEAHDEEDDHHDEGGEDEDDHDHGHGDFDPHYWLDPVRSAESVETIAEGVAEADPENADVYEENAAEFAAELEALDETFEEELSGRELDTVVVAAHNSHQYLAARYGFEVHSPVGVSPNAEPSSAEIKDTINVVDERGIDVVLYDTFESPTLAETIVRESNATEAVPLSPAEGTKPEWLDDGWGYVEQMKEINLPALKRALKTA